MSDKTRYWVIHTTEDGDASLQPHTADELRKRLDQKYWGENIQFIDVPKATWRDLSAESGVIIIKGEIVVPKPKEVVRTWDVGED